VFDKKIKLNFYYIIIILLYYIILFAYSKYYLSQYENSVEYFVIFHYL